MTASPSSTRLAPIVVFAYKRRGHLARTISSLLGNSEASATHLHVYCDAARSPDELLAVNEVRDYVNNLTGFASVTRVFRKTNVGLAGSVIDGVSQLLREYDRIIVIEDDLVLSPYFLRYMNDGLDVYADDDSVANIHAYSLPVKEDLPETFFLRGADCWGWATWRRAWKHFRPDGAGLLKELRERGLTREFDFDGSYPYTRMLKDQVLGKNSSWAIRWHASCYLAERLTLYPGRSLVENIGNDATGTHSGNTADFSRPPTQQRVHINRLPLSPSAAARTAFVNFFNARHGSPLMRIGRKLSSHWHRGS